jgi:hypothetical protein
MIIYAQWAWLAYTGGRGVTLVAEIHYKKRILFVKMFRKIAWTDLKRILEKIAFSSGENWKQKCLRRITISLPILSTLITPISFSHF